MKLIGNKKYNIFKLKSELMRKICPSLNYIRSDLTNKSELNELNK
jgi:hypothetical protein